MQGPIPVEAGLQLMVIATSSLLEAVSKVICIVGLSINIAIAPDDDGLEDMENMMTSYLI